MERIDPWPFCFLCVLKRVYYISTMPFDPRLKESANSTVQLGTVSLALFPRLHIRCMKKAPKTALCAKETKKEPETFRFPAFSGRSGGIPPQPQSARLPLPGSPLVSADSLEALSPNGDCPTGAPLLSLPRGLLVPNAGINRSKT